MGAVEQKIKAFAREQGVPVVGVAGPERLDGPPSLDPTYTMRGARSIVSLALPMDVPAIEAFLAKKSPAPHNLDQLRMNQQLHRVSSFVAGYIRSLGFRAAAVPSNNTYRRSPDIFATHPSFSHRFGAIAAGIGAQGWSGNVMTREFGAAIYLGTVVTEAVLESDPPLPPRAFIDGHCRKCKMCEKTCASGMFEAQREEYVLLNGELHPRGKRRNIDFCNATCFGLHSLSRDKKWTSWGTRWIPEWVNNLPDGSNKLKVRYALIKAASTSGDSTPRYDFIRRIGAILYPQEIIDEYLGSHPEDHPEAKRFRDYLMPFARKLGVTNVGDLADERILTCGMCAMVCGPTVEETGRRLRLLEQGGLVVPGPDGATIVASTFEEAIEARRRFLPKVSRWKIIWDAIASTLLWSRFYLGIEPRSIFQSWRYDRRLKLAISQMKQC